MRRSEFQYADELVLVVERRHHHVAQAFFENLLFNRGALWIRAQVFDNQQFPLRDGLFEDGTGKILDAILRRISADSAIFDVGAVIEYEDLISLQGRQAKEQIRLAKEGAQLRP